jgi:hypothetical protein
MLSVNASQDAKITGLEAHLMVLEGIGIDTPKALC